MIRKFLKSCSCAMQGIRYVATTQRNMKIHLAVAVGVTAAGIYFQLSIQEWIILVVTILLVLVGEMINTAIEKIVDMISPEYRMLAGQAKDVAAGAVLLSAIGAIVIGILLFGPKVWEAFCLMEM